VFVLGAYPSAIHVAWVPPNDSGLRRVAALPVADEPVPFWDGSDDVERIDRWRRGLGLDLAVHGRFSSPGRLNGSSGRWLDIHVLRPLNCGRHDAWITDCLDTYRLSTGVKVRLADTYDAGRVRYGWPEFHVGPHPSEKAIVDEARQSHVSRLRQELECCEPELVVTLGNAACRTVHELAGVGPRRLSVTGYGQRHEVDVGGGAVEWLALAHPAAPRRYQRCHEQWEEQL
jgi:hypothetical protein